ncbi:MAG TPA: hypothetical protein VFK03_04250 [Candidatus Saccharimonadales bacterium]|nr:hypothetical protein [Candidatus Saccharimonadales bacterium]
MKVLILYRPKSEHGRAVENFVRDFKTTHTSNRLEVLDIDSRDGSAIATLYDIMQYPAVLALRDDGSVVKSWEGELLPVMNELAYYTFSAD